MRKEKNILWVDRWKKYVWLSYIQSSTNIILPIWNISNDWSLFFSLWDVLNRYNIKKIVVWYPREQEDIKESIDNFLKQINYIVEEDISIIKINEDYTSVEAWAVIWEFKKTTWEDTVAAMKILERYQNLKDNDSWL